MMIDAHAHYEPRLLGEKDLLNLIKNEQIDRMILVPHLQNPPESTKPAALMAIQRLLLSFNLTRPIASWLTRSMYRSDGTWNLGPLKWLMNKNVSTIEIIQRPDHSQISDLVNRYPETFGQWLFVNPNFTTAEDLELLIKSSKNVFGIKLHPFWHKFKLDKFSSYADIVRKYKLPVSIHLGHNHKDDLRELIDNYSDINFVFKHLGGPYYGALWKLIEDRPNFYLDIASTYHVDERILRNAVKAIGSNRILFASDTPYTAPETMTTLKRWVQNLPIDESKKLAILELNFKRLLKISDTSWSSEKPS